MAFKCNICGFSAETREELLEHMFEHTSSAEGDRFDESRREAVEEKSTDFGYGEPSVVGAPPSGGGIVLWVDLDAKQVRTENVDAGVLREFIGGRGWAVKLLYDSLPAGIHPFSPENLLVFATGPLSGSGAPTSGRFSVVSKSPLTGTISDSNCGGSFAPALRGSGFDYVVVSGRSEKPVYLWLNEGQAELRDAAHIWGRDIFQSTDALRDETAEDVSTLCIGQAGEKLSLIASIINDKHRAAGRTGLGAVMGSKRLKAVVARGRTHLTAANREAFTSASRDAVKTISENPVTGEGLPSYGTAILVNIINENGAFPTNNFQEGVFEGANAISGETIAEEILDERYGCWGCPIKCGRKTSIKKGNYSGESGGGPEYETVFSLGSCCGISDLAVVTRANYLCNQHGLDTISAGVTIATLMELYQRGYVTDKDLDGGPQPRFGRSAALMRYLELMAERSGLGDIMAQGAMRLAERFGAPELAMTVKGLELPAYDPRGFMGHALAYATSNRGGCHVRGYVIAAEVLGIPETVDRFETEGKSGLVKAFQDLFTSISSMGLCIFSAFALNADQYAKMLAAHTGISYTADSLLKAGERTYNLERMFNQREGFGRKDDTLPPRFLNEPLAQGASAGKTVPLESMLDEYYQTRGWDADGNPTPQKKAELGL